MKYIIIGFALTLLSIQVNSQSVSCDDLYQFVIEKGSKKGTVPSYLMNSSWLNKVTAYSYEYKIYVVAEIKQNEFDFKPKSYIFCGIPSLNWQYFQFGGVGDSQSYGERFHKYIMDYKCNCK